MIQSREDMQADYERMLRWSPEYANRIAPPHMIFSDTELDPSGRIQTASTAALLTGISIFTLGMWALIKTLGPTKRRVRR